MGILALSAAIAVFVGFVIDRMAADEKRESPDEYGEGGRP